MRRRLRRYLLVASVLTLSLTTTLAAFVLVRGWDQERLRADFERRAERKSAALDRALADAMDVLEALRDLHVSTEFDRTEFRQFVRRPLSANRAVRAVMWAPRVTQAERVRWERAAPGDGLGISELDANRRVVRAAVREAYFPIQHLEPKGVRPVGFDLTSDPDIAHGLARALASEEAVAFVEESESLLVLLPVSRIVQREHALAGIVVGRLSVKDVIEATGADHDDEGLRLTFRRGAPELATEPLAWRRPVSFAGEMWTTQVLAAPDYEARHQRGRSWTILVGGLAVTAGLVGMIAVEASRRRTRTFADLRLEVEVGERHRLEVAARRFAARGAELVTTLDPGEVGERVVSVVADLCGAHAVLYRAEAERGDLICVAARCGDGLAPDDEGDVIGTVEPLGESLLGRAVAERRIVGDQDLTDVRQEGLPTWLATMVHREAVGTILALPLVGHDSVLGVLLVVTPREHRLTTDEIHLLAGFTDQAALAKANARNHARATERAEKLAALSALTELIASTMSSSAVFNAIAKAAVTLLGADIARVWVADRVRKVLRVEGRFGLAPDAERGLTDFSEMPFGSGLVGRIYESGSPLYVGDLQAQPGLLNRRLVSEGALRSMAGVPLVTGGTVLGALAIVFRDARTFTEEDKELMGLLASQAAIAIDNTRLLEMAEQRRHDAEDLAEFGRTLTRSLEPGAVAQACAERILTLLGAKTATVFHAGAETEPLAIAGRLDAPEADDAVTRVAALVAGVAARTTAPVLVTDVIDDPRIAGDPALRRRAASEIGTLLAMPLSTQHTLVATLGVADGRRFRDEEVRSAEAYADRAALALYNARLHAETQTQLRRAEALLTVGQAVGGLREEPELLRQATWELVRLLDADAGGTWTLTAESDRLVPQAGYRLPDNVLVGLQAPSADYSGELLTLIRAHERAYGWDDSRSESCFEEVSKLVPNHRSILIVPLRRNGDVIGTMVLAWIRQPHHFTRDELDLVDAVAGQVTLSLENFRLVEQLRTRQARLETLLDVNRQLSIVQPVESLLERIAEACGRVLDCGSIGIRVREGDELVLAGSYGDAAVMLPMARVLKVGEGLAGAVAATGEPMITNDLGGDPRHLAAHRPITERLGYHAYLGVPVKLGDDLLGVLSAGTKRPEGFNADDVAIATAFAAQAAAAIENARLYERAQQAYRQMAAAQEQLVAAQKMEAIGRLAGGIAHDFNNLLTVIAGRATLLEADLPPGDRLRRHAELIQSTAARAGSLTQQLLAFGRRQVLQPKVVQLNDIVHSMGAMLRPLIGEHNELVVTLEPDLPFVKVDPAQLEQVVVNLVVNARDAMPGGGRVSITTTIVEVSRDGVPVAGEVPCGTWIRLSVADTGIGMDAATRSQIFEPFFTTKGQGEGTGLGLATVYGIIKQSGGYLDVQSEPGLGTMLAIYLPVVMAVRDDVSHVASTAMRGGTETILLVEDEAAVRELLCEILESCGYSVLTARDGLEALTLWQERGASIDLVVSDVVMPRMNGPEFIRRVSAVRPGIAVIYISGYNDLPMADLATLPESGALLEKPFTPDTVAAKVREALDTQPSRASA